MPAAEMSSRSPPPDSQRQATSGVGEFDLIESLRRRAGSRDDVVLGIGDDAAILQVPPGQQLIVSTDTLVAGVHFTEDSAAADIGWKVLAVNLSDLAAMGAQPAWASLALTLPDADPEWLDGFIDGFSALAAEHDVALVGGDTTHGPLCITVTVHGFAPAAMALRRDGARCNDDIWVTGTLGDAAGALSQWRGKGFQSAKLRHRLDRPTPRIAAGIALRGLASAAIDISDGLLADLGHVLQRSSAHLQRSSALPSRAFGAEVDLGRLPTARTLAEHFPDEPARWRLQLGGGDDYELCFTAPAANSLLIEKAMAACDTAATVIGRVGNEDSGKIILRTPEGDVFETPSTGFQHFSGCSN